MVGMRERLLLVWVLVGYSACVEPPAATFDVAAPARGPGLLVGRGPAPSDGTWQAPRTAQTLLLAPRALGPSEVPGVSVTPSELEILAGKPCDADCLAFCDGLGLENPIDKALCSRTWGLGLSPTPVVSTEACRRLAIDVLGVMPTFAELQTFCPDASVPDGVVDWGAVVRSMLEDPRFRWGQRRLWADKLLFHNRTVNIERIYDADALVDKTYQGRVPYDQFAAVVSAHPVLTRRYATPGERVDALFRLFMGRVPFSEERADLGRLYALWSNGYYDHAGLGRRFPDATIRHRCVDDSGQPDSALAGPCTSRLWGENQVVLSKDIRTTNGEMWSGLLRPDEWYALQLPGRIVAGQLAFWDHTVDEVLKQYLGYDLGFLVPEVRAGLVRYLIENRGDIRAVHHAVLTSRVYLQSNSSAMMANLGEVLSGEVLSGEVLSEEGGADISLPEYFSGPVKQVGAEIWINGLTSMTGVATGDCDPRMPDPGEFLRNDDGEGTGRRLVENSRWPFRPDGKLDTRYRDLARTLGGCPENQAGGRFSTVSILTTASQEEFVRETCQPGCVNGRGCQPERGAPIAELLPPGLVPDTRLNDVVAKQVLDFQSQKFLGRLATSEERDDVTTALQDCAEADGADGVETGDVESNGIESCRVEAFARPLCFALLSGAEMLFY